jgi:MerR family redox-sensitive transcriptional activator SoxR
MNNTAPAMTIGQVARHAGLRASAIRFYEKVGLLPQPIRTSGQRRYGNKVLERLAVLEFAKQCGFTLTEIRQLFNGPLNQTGVSVRWQTLARKKVVELDTMVERISVMKGLLERALACRCVDVEECGRRILKREADR